jgi:hypothetical protein
MYPLGGERWAWSLIGSPSVEFCVWTLVQDGLHVRPFDVHANGNERLRQGGMDASSWVRWLEVVVRRDVDDQERVRRGGDLEAPLFYDSDPPTREEQLKMKEVLRAKTPPALWMGSDQIAEQLDSLWDDFSSRPVLRRNRRRRPRWDREEPGTSENDHELYTSLREVGSRLPSLHCYSVAYPALVVRPVAPMALVLTSPKQWTWARYRDALVAGAAELAAG